MAHWVGLNGWAENDGKSEEDRQSLVDGIYFGATPTNTRRILRLSIESQLVDQCEGLFGETAPAGCEAQHPPAATSTGEEPVHVEGYGSVINRDGGLDEVKRTNPALSGNGWPGSILACVGPRFETYAVRTSPAFAGLFAPMAPLGDEPQLYTLLQSQLAASDWLEQSVIVRLEDGDYAGHSLTMLQRIAACRDRPAIIVACFEPSSSPSLRLPRPKRS